MHLFGGHQPYTYQGCPYYKVESMTKMMPRGMFEDRLRAHKPSFYSWESQVADEVSIADLDEKQIRSSLRLGVEKSRMPSSVLTEPMEDVLDKLSLLNNGKPINAAVLFSVKAYQYTQLKLLMAHFRRLDKSEFIDTQRVEGHFFPVVGSRHGFLLEASQYERKDSRLKT